MEKLATIQLNLREPGGSGRDIVIKAMDVEYAIADTPSAGCDVYCYNGKVWKVTETVTNIYTAIDTLWGEYITALGDPA